MLKMIAAHFGTWVSGSKAHQLGKARVSFGGHETRRVQQEIGMYTSATS